MIPVALTDHSTCIAKAMHNTKRIPIIYKSSLLPNAKTIRKAFFEDPGLFFYIKECQQFWEMLNDVNLFRELITCNYVYDILSQFHLYPGTVDFYKDFIKVKGARALVNRLKDYSYETNVEAVMYVNLNDSAKRQERLKWKKNIRRVRNADEGDGEEGENNSLRLPDTVKYSTPFEKADSRIAPCVIDGFSFSWLSTSADYYETGCILHNCLRSWKRSDNPVIVVKRGNTAVAAIEVDANHHFVVQAKTARNKHVDEDSDVSKAYEKWKKKFSIDERRIQYGEEFPLLEDELR